MQTNNKYLEFLLHLIFIQTNEARDRLSTHWIKNSFILFEIFDDGGGSLYADLYIFFLSIFSISLCMLLHNNELKYGFDTRRQ